MYILVLLKYLFTMVLDYLLKTEFFISVDFVYMYCMDHYDNIFGKKTTVNAFKVINII